MTDRAPASRWLAALVLGPVTAALFTATTAWASTHAPASTPDAASSTSAPADPTADIQQTLDEEAARVRALEQLVASLRAQAAAIGVTAPSGGRQAGAGAAGAAPAPVAARPPAARRTSRPPAVHTVTGASSAQAVP